MTEKFNYLSLPRITKFRLALYQKLISMGMHLILQSLVLVSKIAQFKSYAAGLKSKILFQLFQERVIVSVGDYFCCIHIFSAKLLISITFFSLKCRQKLETYEFDVPLIFTPMC